MSNPFSIPVPVWKVDRNPSVLVHVDPELLDQALPPFDVRSDDEDARSRVEEGDPISSSEDGDGVVEEREGVVSEGFGDEKEVCCVWRRSGRGEGSGELIVSEGEREDPVERLGGAVEARKVFKGRREGHDSEVRSDV